MRWPFLSQGWRWGVGGNQEWCIRNRSRRRCSAYRATLSCNYTQRHMKGQGQPSGVAWQWTLSLELNAPKSRKHWPSLFRHVSAGCHIMPNKLCKDQIHFEGAVFPVTDFVVVLFCSALFLQSLCIWVLDFIFHLLFLQIHHVKNEYLSRLSKTIEGYVGDWLSILYGRFSSCHKEIEVLFFSCLAALDSFLLSCIYQKAIREKLLGPFFSKWVKYTTSVPLAKINGYSSILESWPLIFPL